MAVVFSGLNLNNNDEICLPFEVSGTVTSTAPTKIVAGAKQIDDGDAVDIAGSCDPILPNDNPGAVAFAVLLTRFDCPFPDTNYMLTLLFWDDGEEPCLTQESIAFKVLPAASCE